MARFQELKEELATVFAGQGMLILDSIIPLVLFLGTNPILEFTIALWISIGAAFVIVAFRLIRRENLRYALTGLGGVGLAAGIVYLSGSFAGYFIPGLISGGVTVLLCLFSILLKKPLAAWTSHITRRWPLDWYWHDQIRPAYSEVTLTWAVAFSLRLGLEFQILNLAPDSLSGLFKLLLGWPYTILILIISYLYGIWRLGNLQGPSVEEYKMGTESPWEGQKRGF